MILTILIYQTLYLHTKHTVLTAMVLTPKSYIQVFRITFYAYTHSHFAPVTNHPIYSKSK